MTKKLFAIPLLMAAFGAQAGVAVIGNANLGEASDKDIKKVFMGKKADLGGVTVTVVDQKEGSAARKAFYENVVGMSESEVKGYRAEQTFTGKGAPPKEVGDDAAVKSFVSSTPGAIGYIDDSKVDGSVKVLYKK